MTGPGLSAAMQAAPMNIASMLAAMALGSLGAVSPAMAQISTSTPTPISTPAPTPPSTSDDRIVVSADGTTLTGTNGGAGASLGWLHNFDASNIAGIAVEHQGLSDAQWTFASLNGSTAIGPADQRYTFSGEAHEGAGHDGVRAFHYRIEAVDVAGTYDSKLIGADRGSADRCRDDAWESAEGRVDLSVESPCLDVRGVSVFSQRKPRNPPPIGKNRHVLGDGQLVWGRSMGTYLARLV